MAPLELSAANDHHQKFPATGQTTCSDSTGTVIACAGTGQDGEIQAGVTLRYRDNSNGTVTDENTRLVWEKKSDDSGIHDKDDVYIWDEAFAVVAALNNSCKNDETVACTTNADCAGVGGKCGFAGNRDWRVPNVKELQSIVNYGVIRPSVSPAFNTNCVAGATVLTGSCTAVSLPPISNLYYTSSSVLTIFPQPQGVWLVDFSSGSIFGDSKPDSARHVRAVRGGL